MNAETIACACGGKRSGRGWLICCPAHPDKNPSCTVADGDNGKLLVKCWAGCDARDVLAALRQRGLLDDGCNLSHKTYGDSYRLRQAPPLEWSQGADDIWQKTLPIYGTPVEAYLRSRGCFVPCCNDLRFLPARGKGYPAMVALITDAITGYPLSLHFTYLQRDGSGKAPIERPKVLLKGHRKSGGIIRLTDDDSPPSGLGVTEGIETALACVTLGWSPVWAAIDASNLANLPILDEVECLTILADRDSAGLKAAQHCANRWLAAGHAVNIFPPDEDGLDWADVVRSSGV